MGEARTRRLRVAEQQENGQPITITLGPRAARRLAVLRAAAEGAQATVQAATQAAQTMAARYEESVAGVLEAEGVEVSPRTQVSHDADAGTLTVGERGAAPVVS